MPNWFLNFSQLLFHHRMKTLIIQVSSSESGLLRSLDLCFVACFNTLQSVSLKCFSLAFIIVSKRSSKAFESVVQHSGLYCSIRATQSQVPLCSLLMPVCFVSSGTKYSTTPRRKLGLELFSALSVWIYLLVVRLPEKNGCASSS